MNKWLLISLLIIAAAVRILFFAISVDNLPPVMDESIMALQSKMIVESKDTEAAQAKLFPYPPMGRFPLLFMSQPYLFPIDSYFNALTIWATPRNAFGVRLAPFMLGLLGTILTLKALCLATAREKNWPAISLVLFPSSYLLMLKCGYTPPSYVSFMLFISLISIMCLRPARSEGRIWIWAAATGLISGLAVATQMIAAPFLVGAFAVYAFRSTFLKSLLSSGAFIMGAIAGFAPIPMARHLYPGAHAAISGTLPLQEAIGKLWNPTLSYTLPTTMGLHGTLFPDSVNRIQLFPGMDILSALLWLAVMLYATGLALIRFIERVRRTKRLKINIFEMLIAASWMTIAMFCLSSRAYSDSFRYLLGAVWALPFIFAFCIANSRGLLRKLAVALTIALAALNLASSVNLMRHWSRDGFAAQEPRAYDLRPAISHLEQIGIDRCYANYFDAYRINYMTDEDIICSQHYNLRFYGWPLPYKEAVDSCPDPAFVLGPSWRFTPQDFERDMEIMGVSYARTNCGPASVYTDFKLIDPSDTAIPHAMLTIQTSHASDQAGALIDGIYGSQWSLQRDGSAARISIELRLEDPLPVCRVSLYYNCFSPGQTPDLDISVFDGSEWQRIAEGEQGKVDDVIFRNGHPIYGDREQAFRFETVKTDRIRIETNMDNLKSEHWTLGEIAIYSPKTLEAKHGTD